MSIRVIWAVNVARRVAAARGLMGEDVELFAQMFKRTVASIANLIMELEPESRVGEIALHILRHSPEGTHTAELPQMLIETPPEEAAHILIGWASEGPRLASSNPAPRYTPRRAFDLTTIDRDGICQRWRVEPVEAVAIQHGKERAR